MERVSRWVDADGDRPPPGAGTMSDAGDGVRLRPTGMVVFARVTGPGLECGSPAPGGVSLMARLERRHLVSQTMAWLLGR